MHAASTVWCASTNLACVLPSYKIRHLNDWVLYLVTGVVSVLYHLHHHIAGNRQPPLCSFLDYEAIRTADLVMSDMCMCWIAAYILDKNIKDACLFLFLPIDMYIVCSRNELGRWLLYGVWVSVSFLYVFRNYKNYSIMNFARGAACSVGDLCFYKFLPDRYPIYYDWIHGVHHIFGFASIYFYIQAVRADQLYNSLEFSL